MIQFAKIKEVLTLKFSKMHGCKNDFVIINCFDEKISNAKKLAFEICDRRSGIGADGLILVERSNKADVFMRIFNSDGSEDTMCGNGIRCTAKFIYEHGIINKNETSIETLSGVKNISLEISNNKVKMISVNMGKPIITSETPEKIVVNNKKLKFYGIDTGTAHAVYFVEDNPEIFGINEWLDSDFAKEGFYFENHERFPERTTSDFIEIISRDEINMRVFERGCGETLACGTGATASVFAGVISGKLNRDVIVHLKGGDLRIKVDEDNTCFLIGEAVEVFEGEYFANV